MTEMETGGQGAQGVPGATGSKDQGGKVTHSKELLQTGSTDSPDTSRAMPRSPNVSTQSTQPRSLTAKEFWRNINLQQPIFKAKTQTPKLNKKEKGQNKGDKCLRQAKLEPAKFKKKKQRTINFEKQEGTKSLGSSQMDTEDKFMDREST